MNKLQPTNSANICNEVYKLYKDILNSYVSDFYLENHWDQKLSNSWKLYLENLSLSEFGELLDYEKPLKTASSPLTILCIHKILRTFSITRKQQNLCVSPTDKSFLKFFWKNVKLKKRHEIEIMSKVCYQIALETNCFNIVDIGSGLGHLSRMLAYKYGLRVCTFEANEYLTDMAPKLDFEFEKILSVKKIPHLTVRKPVHINKRIEETLCSDEFTSIVRRAFNNFDDGFYFGIVGLHPCGNLGSTLLRLYSDSPNAAFINIVSCCYMKLSLDPPVPQGFPLSDFYKKHNFKLDYLSCETACHAIENYVEKMKTQNYCHFKIHSFRAALECMLVNTNESFRHCAVGNVKYEEGMDFREYCNRALKKHKLKICDSDLEKYNKVIKDTWMKVVKFYSVRLFLAPIVESLILYDRLLYLKESKSDCDILPVFDCRISPRNHVLSARKIL